MASASSLEKLNQFIRNINNDNDSIKIIKSNTIQNAVDLNVYNEDHTLGNIIQSHMCLFYKIETNGEENEFNDCVNKISVIPQGSKTYSKLFTKV